MSANRRDDWWECEIRSAWIAECERSERRGEIRTFAEWLADPDRGSWLYELRAAAEGRASTRSGTEWEAYRDSRVAACPDRDVCATRDACATGRGDRLASSRDAFYKWVSTAISSLRYTAAPHLADDLWGCLERYATGCPCGAGMPPPLFLTCEPGDESPDPVIVRVSWEQEGKLEAAYAQVREGAQRIESGLATIDAVLRVGAQAPGAPRRLLARVFEGFRKNLSDVAFTLMCFRHLRNYLIRPAIDRPPPPRHGRPARRRRQQLMFEAFAVAEANAVPLTAADTGTLATLVRIMLGTADDLDGNRRRDRGFLYRVLRKSIADYSVTMTTHRDLHLAWLRHGCGGRLDRPGVDAETGARHGESWLDRNVPEAYEFRFPRCFERDCQEHPTKDCWLCRERAARCPD